MSPNPQCTLNLPAHNSLFHICKVVHFIKEKKGFSYSAQRHDNIRGSKMFQISAIKYGRKSEGGPSGFKALESSISPKSSLGINVVQSPA
jgi:hypothetical protein